LKKIINQAINARATFGILGQDTKIWNDGAIKGDVEAMKRMYNLDTIDKDDNVSVYFDENHKLTFRVVGHTMVDDGMGNMIQGGDVSYNMDQLRKNIPEANLEADAVILETLNSVEEQAKKAGEKGVDNWSEDEINSIFSKQIQTKEDFTNLAFRRLDDIDEQSFKTNLMENMDIAISTMDVTFQNMFKELLDKNKDKKIDGKDIAGLSGADLAIFKSNYKQMIDVLTNVDNDNFNLDRSKNLLAEYFTGFAEQKYESSYDAAYEEANPTINLKNIEGQSRIGNDGELYNPAKGMAEQVGSGYKYNRQGQLLYNENKKLTQLKKHEQVIDAFGNTYEPTIHTVEGGGMEVDYDVKGYIVRDSEGVPIKFDDEWERPELVKEGKIYKTKDGYIFYTIDQAKRNLVGTSKSLG